MIALPHVRSPIARIRWTIALAGSRLLVPPGRSRFKRGRHAIRILLVVVASRIRHKVSMEIHTGIRHRRQLAHSSRSVSDAPFYAETRLSVNGSCLLNLADRVIIIIIGHSDLLWRRSIRDISGEACHRSRHAIKLSVMQSRGGSRIRVHSSTPDTYARAEKRTRSTRDPKRE
jgi:hypothetical protein